MLSTITIITISATFTVYSRIALTNTDKCTAVKTLESESSSTLLTQEIELHDHPPATGLAPAGH